MPARKRSLNNTAPTRPRKRTKPAVKPVLTRIPYTCEEDFVLLSAVKSLNLPTLAAGNAPFSVLRSNSNQIHTAFRTHITDRSMPWNNRSVAAVQSRVVRLVERHLNGVVKPREGDPYEQQMRDMLITLTGTQPRRARASPSPTTQLIAERTPRKRKVAEPRAASARVVSKRESAQSSSPERSPPRQRGRPSLKSTTPRQRQTPSPPKTVAAERSPVKKAIRVDADESDPASYMLLVRECRKLIESKHNELLANAEIEKHRTVLEGKKLDLEKLRLELEKQMISENTPAASKDGSDQVSEGGTQTDKILNVVLSNIEEAEKTAKAAEELRMQRLEVAVDKLANMGEVLLKRQQEMENTLNQALNKVAEAYTARLEAEKEGMLKMEQAIADIAKTQEMIEENDKEREEMNREREDRLMKEREGLQLMISQMAEKQRASHDDLPQENGTDEIDGHVSLKEKVSGKDVIASVDEKEKPLEEEKSTEKEKADDVNKQDDMRDGLEELLATLTEEKNG